MELIRKKENEIMEIVVALSAILVGLVIAYYQHRERKKDRDISRRNRRDDKITSDEMTLRKLAENIRLLESKNRDAGILLEKSSDDSFEFLLDNYKASTANWLDAWEEACELYVKSRINKSKFRDKFEEDMRRVYEFKQDDNPIIYNMLRDGKELTYKYFLSSCNDMFT